MGPILLALSFSVTLVGAVYLGVYYSVLLVLERFMPDSGSAVAVFIILALALLIFGYLTCFKWLYGFSKKLLNSETFRL